MEETGRKKKVPARRKVARKKLKKKTTDSYEVSEVTNLVGGLTLPGMPSIVVGNIEETRSQPGSRRGSTIDPEARAREIVRRESVALPDPILGRWAEEEEDDAFSFRSAGRRGSMKRGSVAEDDFGARKLKKIMQAPDRNMQKNFAWDQVDVVEEVTTNTRTRK